MSFGLKSNLASLKTEFDKLDIDKLKSLPNNLSNLKSKGGKLYIDKSGPVPAGLSKLSNVLKTRLLKRLNIMLRSKILKIKYLILLN